MTTVHRKNRRAQIIAAAGRLFESRGSVDFTAEDLAQEAGISRRTIFNYVASPHEATCEYIGGHLSEVMCIPQNVHNIHTPTQVYHHVIEQIRSKRTFEIIQLIDHATRGTHGQRDPKWQAYIYQKSELILIETLAQCLPDLNPIERRLFARGILSTVENAFTIWIESETKTRQEWNELSALALTFYFHGFIPSKKGGASWLNS